VHSMRCKLLPLQINIHHLSIIKRFNQLKHLPIKVTDFVVDTQ
jgi:hypothetical protein